MPDRDVTTAVQQRLNIYLHAPYFENSPFVLLLNTIKIKARLCWVPLVLDVVHFTPPPHVVISGPKY